MRTVYNARIRTILCSLPMAFPVCVCVCTVASSRAHFLVLHLGRIPLPPQFRPSASLHTWMACGIATTEHNGNVHTARVVSFCVCAPDSRARVSRAHRLETLKHSLYWMRRPHSHICTRTTQHIHTHTRTHCVVLSWCVCSVCFYVYVLSHCHPSHSRELSFCTSSEWALLRLPKRILNNPQVRSMEGYKYWIALHHTRCDNFRAGDFRTIYFLNRYINIFSRLVLNVKYRRKSV